MSTSGRSGALAEALTAVAPAFRGRLVQVYTGVKQAQLEGRFDICGLRAGKFCEVLLRLLQHALTGTYTPFGTKISNFRRECDLLEQRPATAGPESLRVLIPRALAFVYTLRNKRGIGHEGGDVEANGIDAATIVRLTDWCIAELVRVYHRMSLEEAQALCDAIAQRHIPVVWEVLGRKRVLDPQLSYADKTLLLLYSSLDFAVPEEDLVQWVEHPRPRQYRTDVLKRMHRARLLEYDSGTHMVVLAPPGVRRAEDELLSRAV